MLFLLFVCLLAAGFPASAQCTYTLTPSAVNVAANDTTGTLAVGAAGAASCTWTSVSSDPWLIINFGQSGTNGGTVGYRATRNNSIIPRSATITVGNATATINQAAATNCTFTLAPASASFRAAGGGGSFTVASSCLWDAQPSASWITASISGTAVSFNVAANPAGTPRSGAIQIGNAAFAITQAGAVIVTGLQNAASFRTGAVAPGTIVTLYGFNIGPPALARLALTPDGRFVATQLFQTIVLFDGVPAPLIYASQNQTSAIVPYSVGARPTTEIRVEYQGQRSPPFNADVQPVAPAIFTQQQIGSGPGAILNQDFSLNTAANPAARGSVVMIYGTGDGATTPAGVDGRVMTPPYAATNATVRARVGGLDARIWYAGSSPNLVAGLVQVNVQIPDDAPTSDRVPVILNIGGVDSQTGVTLSVR